MSRKVRLQIAVGDRFKVANSRNQIFEVLAIRDMIPAPHALIVKEHDRQSPVLIAVSVLLDRNFYEKLTEEAPPAF
ncbi:hypothetical protein [Thalassospira sp.]|uniref:hypothetical protein n=1 Tax=Thalassospira sp. TaxID=1912094 RepID=UPI002736832C|nr:hypothetical protein [Thalassospira sp.]MDP2700124.1 hypothetical protein [Thalassospira sp.]